tara:strand:- start:636 stop:866 length:231 start_codon:yes stop_codon:yes gene_type:complete
VVPAQLSLQARWALLPPLVALAALSNGASLGVALATLGEPLLGMSLGGAVSTMALLLPFPRLASLQVRAPAQTHEP